jgi:hypothetical protein
MIILLDILIVIYHDISTSNNLVILSLYTVENLNISYQ